MAARRMAQIAIACAVLLGCGACARSSASPLVAHDQLAAELQAAGLSPIAAACVADSLADVTYTRADLDAIYDGAPGVDVAKANRFDEAVATCVASAPSPADGT